LLESVLLFFVVDLLVCVAVCYLELQRTRRALDKERYDHSITRERLLASHKDGWVIPPPPSPAEPEEDLSLPDELAPIWEQWEGPGREPQKRIMRDAIKAGRTVDSLLKEYAVSPSPE
jgi:hypothetical protein